MTKLSNFVLVLLLSTLLAVIPNIEVVKANETIYIREDGSVEGTDKIQREGNIYTFTDDIFNQSIVVEADNIVVDGAGYTLQGTGSGTGMSLTSRSNVTIRNTEIKNFGVGVLLMGSSNNLICGNRITNNGDGVFITDLWLDTYGIGSLNNSVVGNNITLSSGNVILNRGCGVKITRWSKQNIVSQNIIARNGEGIYVADFSNNTIIIDNDVILNARYGIHLDYYSDGNTIIGNYVANNGWKGPDTTHPPYLIWCGGIRIYRSINNTLRNNQMINNMYNFEILYIFVSGFINDIDTSNTVNGKPIYHWIGERDKTVPSNAGYVALINCTGITVQNLNLANNKDGILITSTKNSIITGNNITNCLAGICLDHSSSGSSSGIVIYENNIMNNDYGIHLGNARENTIYRNNLIINNIGIYFDESEINEIYHNNFINNTDQVRFNGFWMPPFVPARINTWDNGYPSGGNYWSNYEEKYPNATELNLSGIWNTPYVIAIENKDNYPLMHPLIAPPPLDTTPPTISIVSPENKTYLLNYVSLTFTVGDPPSWIGYSLDGRANFTIAGNTTLTELSEGTHSLTVYAKDAAGNVGSSDTINFTIDSPPSISILSPQNRTYHTTDIPLDFTVTEPVSWVSCSLDGQANVTITGNTTFGGLSYGSHSLTIYAEDFGGNIGASETVYFTIAQESAPFPTWIVAVIVIIAIVGVALLVYFGRIRKTAKVKEVPEGVM